MSGALQTLAPSAAAASAADFVQRIGLADSQAHAGRPRVVAAMIGSLDGRATVDGRAGGLGSPADRELLRELRTAADALLVGSGTLIAEQYATVLDQHQQQRRLELELSAEPLIATISRGLDERLTRVPLFSEPGTRIQVYTESERALPETGAEVSVLRRPPGQLDAKSALAHLHEQHGVRLVVSEGGPTLLRELFAADLVDDLVLTLAPLLVAGGGRSLLHGPFLDPPAALRLREVMRGGDHLFLRYSAGA